MKQYLISLKYGWKLFIHSIFTPKEFVASMKMYDVIEQKHEKLINLTDKDLWNICLSYRHDFGLLSYREKKNLKLEAKEWARAIYNNKLISGK